MEALQEVSGQLAIALMLIAVVWMIANTDRGLRFMEAVVEAIASVPEAILRRLFGG